MRGSKGSLPILKAHFVLVEGFVMAEEAAEIRYLSEGRL